MRALALVIVLSALATPVSAQWLKHPTPGIPRTPDGKPNLTAPVPRTPDGKPDLSGLWQRISPKYRRNIAADLKPEEIQPWARALVAQRMEDLGKGSHGWSSACRGVRATAPASGWSRSSRRPA